MVAMPALSPGRATVERIAATRSWRRFTTDAGGDGWVRFADRLADPPAMDGWLAAELAGTARGHRDLAGSLIAYRFGAALAELTMVPLLAQRRALVLAPEALHVAYADGARIQGISVDDPTVAVLAGDPDAGRPGTLVTDAEGLRATAAEGLHRLYAGLVPTVRSRAPFGRRGLWGMLGDHLADVALRWARELPAGARAGAGDAGDASDAGGDPADRAWAEATAVIDLLAARPGADLRTRPRRQAVTCPAGAAVFATRGTCCLIYKVHEPGPGEPDTTRARIDAAACTSCPLRGEPDRHARLVRHLGERAREAEPKGSPGR
jgi:hypothetical protein